MRDRRLYLRVAIMLAIFAAIVGATYFIGIRHIPGFDVPAGVGYVSTDNDLNVYLRVPGESSAWLSTSEFLIIVGYVVAAYTIPVLIYRFLIRRRRLHRVQAIMSSIMYGAVVFVGALLFGMYMKNPFPGAIVFLWTFINYKLLSAGKRKNDLGAHSEWSTSGRLTALGRYYRNEAIADELDEALEKELLGESPRAEQAMSEQQESSKG